jgi:hypothetical protein
VRRARAGLPLLLASALLWLPGLGVVGQTSQATAKDKGALSDDAAVQLLHQMAAALASRNQTKMLGVFDLAKMKDGALFRQQINSFFSRSGPIRVHFDQVQVAKEVSKEGEKEVITAMVEMEADSRDDTKLPVRKQAELRFVAESSPTGWKFTDVQPREFFSNQP